MTRDIQNLTIHIIIGWKRIHAFSYHQSMLGEKPQTPSCWVQTIPMGPRGRPPSVVTWFVNLYAATLWQLYYIIIHIYIYNKPTYLRLHRKSHRNPDLFGWFFNPPWDTLRTIRRWWSEAILDSSNMVLLGNPHWSIWKNCHVDKNIPPQFSWTLENHLYPLVI